MATSLPGADPVAAVVLAAGAGSRLRPLTRLLPKALCPVANVPLVDLAVGRARTVARDVAVNVHHGRQQLETHLADSSGRSSDPPVHVSVEEREALGTAGALGHLRDWIGGRAVLVLNADSWYQADLTAFVRGWDGEQVRLLTVRDPMRGTWGDRHYVGAALMPWTEVRVLPAEPAGLYEVSWRRLRPGAGLDLWLYEGPAFDCGTPAGYLAANLAASGGNSIVAPDAVVEGTLERSVVWSGGRVGAGERLRQAVRADNRMTVLVR